MRASSAFAAATMRRVPALTSVCLAILVSLPPEAALAMPFAACPDGTVTLLAGRARACAELALTDAQRQRGLMGRAWLQTDGGMLFVYPVNDLHQMWMMNTLVPLSVAFIDESGTIINVEDMQPQTLTVHGALRPARYALEMAQGWFGRHNLAAGSRVEGLPPASEGH